MKPASMLSCTAKGSKSKTMLHVVTSSLESATVVRKRTIRSCSFTAPVGPQMRSHSLWPKNTLPVHIHLRIKQPANYTQLRQLSSIYAQKVVRTHRQMHEKNDSFAAAARRTCGPAVILKSCELRNVGHVYAIRIHPDKVLFRTSAQFENGNKRKRPRWTRRWRCFDRPVRFSRCLCRAMR